MGGYNFTIVDIFIKSCHALVLVDLNLVSRLLVSDSKLPVVTTQVFAINLKIFHQIPLPYFLWSMGCYNFTIVDIFIKSCQALLLLDCFLLSSLLVSDSKLSVVTIQICVINLQIFHQILSPYFLWERGVNSPLNRGSKQFSI